jgi:hypothetical protein
MKEKLSFLEKVKKAFESVRHSIRKYPELLSIPVVLILWVLFGWVLWMYSPESAPFDSAIFQIPIYTAFLLIFALAFTWFILHKRFGTITKYLKSKDESKDKITFKEDFKNLQPWQRIVISVGVQFLLLFAFASLAHVLIAGRV